MANCFITWTYIYQLMGVKNTTAYEPQLVGPKGLCCWNPSPPGAPDFPVRGPRQVRRKLKSRDMFHCERGHSGWPRQGWICTGSRTILGPAILMLELPLFAAGTPGTLELLLTGRSGKVFMNK